MSLPPPAPRKQLHTRRITCEGFLREDGLWDLDAELRDNRHYVGADRERGMLPIGHPVHLMRARLTIDNDLVVRDVATDMDEIPFAYCEGASAGAGGLVGAKIGAGWRRAVDERMKGVKGCSHMRELLYVLATVAFQTVGPYRDQFMKERGVPTQGDSGKPFFMDQCWSWDATGPVVMRFYPEYYRPR